MPIVVAVGSKGFFSPFFQTGIFAWGSYKMVFSSGTKQRAEIWFIIVVTDF